MTRSGAPGPAPSRASIVKSGHPVGACVGNHTTNTTATDGAAATGGTATGTGSGLGDATGGLDGIDLFWWRIIGTLLAFLLTWFVIKVADRALTRSASRIARLRRLDDQRTRALVGRTKPMRFVVRLSVLAILFIALMGIWGLTTAFTGLLAGAGFAGIVIGLAAADTIGDVIAGFLIFYNHPFDIGDWVEIEGVEGIVDDVALGATTLLTFDHEKVTFPNRVVEGGKVRNLSHARRLRRRLSVGVEYGTDLTKARQILQDLARGHQDVFKAPEPDVIITGFGASSVDLVLRFWVEPVRSSAIKVHTELVQLVHDTFRAEGIHIAFPHMQIVQPADRAWHIATEAA